MSLVGMTVFAQGPDGIQRFADLCGEIIVGSDPSCDVVLAGDGVAPVHARLALGPDGLSLHDQSDTGSRIDGVGVLQATAQGAPTAPIEIGPFTLRVQLVERGTDAGPPRTRQVSVALRRLIHRELLDQLDLVKLERSRMNDHLLRAKVGLALQAIVTRRHAELPVGTDTERLVVELTSEAIGLGPLDEMLADPTITEIMLIDPSTIYIERHGQIELTAERFTDEESVRSTIERIVAPLGRRIDESSPMLDARLPDGSRVNAVIRPLALRGTCITIRKFSRTPLTGADLLRFGSVTERMQRFLERCVRLRRNLVISGGTGSGKTTLLNVLSAAIPAGERIVTIEDAAELQLQQPHVVALESRPANMEGRGQVTIRDLVRNAMRMRPDRILVGECRGAEALDMLQAMNTGHSGSMTTTHANSPHEALKRIETLALMAGLDLPSRAIREQIALSVHVVVQQTRLADGSRRIVSIAEVIGLDDDGEVELREIFGFRRTGTNPDGSAAGEFYATGYLPSFLGDFLTHGIVDHVEQIW